MFPIFSSPCHNLVVQFSVLWIFPLTASVVGRTLGTEALAGFSLGSLVGNLTCLSIMTGALTAADIVSTLFIYCWFYIKSYVSRIRSLFVMMMFCFFFFKSVICSHSFLSLPYVFHQWMDVAHASSLGSKELQRNGNHIHPECHNL